MPARARSYRSCCNCCHIKHGTTLMGFLELLIACVLIFFTIDRLIKRHETRGQCFSSFFANCRFNVSISKLDITFTGDYISVVLMCLIVLAIMLLFYGIYSTSSKLLLPHLILQALCLVFSLLYFFAYAWAYFYDDLYVLKRPFQWKSFLERMWLATILLVLACFQFYLFFVVLHCAIYLQSVRAARLRKQRQWTEASEKSARKFGSMTGSETDQQQPTTGVPRNSGDSASSMPASTRPAQFVRRVSLETTSLPSSGHGAVGRGQPALVDPQAMPYHVSHHPHRHVHPGMAKRISDESMTNSLPRTPPSIPRIKILAADGSAAAPVKKVSISAFPAIRNYDPDA